MIIPTLLCIAIFQGIVIGFILLKSPFFKSKKNRYLAFAIFAMSWTLLSVVIDITKATDLYPILKIVSIIDTILLFPLLIFLFVIHQVNYPQKNTNESYWLFIIYLISVAVFAFIEFGLNIESTDNINIISLILIIIFLMVFILFFPFILIKTYRVIQYSKKRAEKRWLFYLWSFEVTILSTFLLLTFIIYFK